MKKRRIYWPYGNPKFDAWEIENNAGLLVIRRNHPLINKGSGNCQGWDIWLDGKYIGAIGSRSLSEITELSRQRLKSITLSACCGRHKEFSSGPTSTSRPGWGGTRPGAGRPFKAEAKRVDLATTVDPVTLQLIDQRRGETSRGEYIDHLVQSQLKQ